MTRQLKRCDNPYPREHIRTRQHKPTAPNHRSEPPFRINAERVGHHFNQLRRPEAGGCEHVPARAGNSERQARLNARELRVKALK
jgi:hypothetical protein